MNNYFFLNNQYQIPYNVTTPPTSPLVYNYNTPRNANSAVRYKTVALISRDNSKPIFTYGSQCMLKTNSPPTSQMYTSPNSLEPFLVNNSVCMPKSVPLYQHNECLFPLSPLKKIPTKQNRALSFRETYTQTDSQNFLKHVKESIIKRRLNNTNEDNDIHFNSNEREFKQPILLSNNKKSKFDNNLNLLENENKIETKEPDRLKNQNNFDNIINSIDQRILETDNLLKENLETTKETNESQIIKTQNLVEENDFSENKINPDKNFLYYKEKKNKNKKPFEIKIYLQRGENYSQMYNKQKNENKLEVYEKTENKQNIMLEIIKIKKKDTLLEVKSLEEEISLLEKENQVQVLKDRKMEISNKAKYSDKKTNQVSYEPTVKCSKMKRNANKENIFVSKNLDKIDKEIANTLRIFEQTNILIKQKKNIE